MAGLFEIIEQRADEQGKGDGIRIGIRLRVADREVPCAVSKTCRSIEELASEVDYIQQDLNQALKKGESYFRGSSSAKDLSIAPGMPAEEIWKILYEMEDEARFIQAFNGLDEETRSEVANHVFTQCNVFSGKAAFFSAHYDGQSGLIHGDR